jgi:DNA polymerase phi
MSQKNREFLNCFWDLAVNDSGTRISAVEKLLEFIEKSDDRSVDIEYTAKRLIRGISSSREAARQGFASCLTQLLSLGIIDVDYVIEGIKETTKVNCCLLIFSLFIYYVPNCVITMCR